MFSEIGAVFEMLGSDPDCRSIVLSGNGKMFCAGIDLGTLAEMGTVTQEEGDVARKAMQFYKIIRNFQNYHMEIEKVSGIRRYIAEILLNVWHIILPPSARNQS